MIWHIGSFVYNDVINRAISDMNILNEDRFYKGVSKEIRELERPVIKGYIRNNINLSTYISRSLDQMNYADMMIIDSTTLVDKPEEILQTIKGIRVVFPSLKLIYIALDYEKNKLLIDALVRAQFYDFVTIKDYENTQHIETALYYELLDIYFDRRRYYDPIKEFLLNEEEMKKEILKAGYGKNRNWRSLKRRFC